MKISQIKIIALLILTLGVIMFGAAWNMASSQKVYGFETGGSVINSVSTITSGPSDGGSSTTTPTNAGSNVTFTATATDVNNDQYYLAICKTNSVTTGNNSAPTCESVPNTWAISTATNSGSPASVSYATSSGNAESNDWYAFICDKNSSGLCTASSQGSGDTGSPFVVNHAPTFGTVTVTDTSNGEINPGDTLRFMLPNAEIDDDGTINMYICTSATTAFDYGTNSCTGGALICSDTAVNPTSEDASCDETGNTLVPPTDIHSTENFKVYVEDSHDFAGTGTNQQSYTIGNTAPTHDTPELDIHAPVLPNSVGYWQFEDGAGATSFDDETTNNNNVTCTNCPAWTQTGYSGGAYDFTTGNEITISNEDFNFGYNQDFTVSAWVKWDTTASFRFFLMQWYDSADAKSWWIEPANGNPNNLNFCLRDGSGAGTICVGSSSNLIQMGQWYHVVGVADRDTQLRLYINGTEFVSNAPTTGIDITSTANLRIGATNHDGLIDEPHIYNRALSATEISNLYSAYTTPTATSNMDISAKPINIADHDSDTTTVIYNWKKNGTSIDVLNMPFDSNITSTASNAILDYSGTANHGTLGGGNASYVPTWTSSGMKGGAYTFDGVDDYIEVADNNSLDLTNAMTIEFWAKFGASPSDYADQVIGKGLFTTDAMIEWYYYGATSSSPGYLQPSQTINGEWGGQGGFYPTQDVWYHLALTYDGTNSITYKDGVAIGTRTQTGGVATNNYPLYIGKGWQGTFNGSVDEVRIYSTALSAQQIAQNYNNGKPNYNTIVQQEISAADTSWIADTTINDAQTSYSNSTTKSTNALDPGNAEPVQNTPSARAHTPLDSGSVGYWQMEDGTGATAFDDETTNNNNGSCTNCPTYTAEGGVGGAYDFDGTNDVIAIANSSSLNITGSVTLSAWINLDSTTQAVQGIVEKREGTVVQYSLYTRSNDEIAFYTDGGSVHQTSSLNLQTGQWYHVVASFNNTANTLKIYVDGVEVLSESETAEIVSTTKEVRIGRGADAGEFLNGKIDEPHIYNRALSATEIKNLYNSNSYIYGTMDIGASARNLSDPDSDATYITTDWRKNGTSAAVLNMSFNKNVTSVTAGAVTDYSSYANNGQLGGGTASYVPTWTNASTCGNNTGGCYSFDGSNDFIRTSNNGALNFGTGNFNISFWVKTLSTQNDKFLLGFRTMWNPTGFHITTGGYETTEGTVRVAGISGGAIASTTRIDNGTWHFASINRENSNIRIFIDGNLETSGTDNTNWTFASNRPAIGINDFNETANAFYGFIDEIQIYNRALTASQIATEYNAGKANYQNLAYGELAVGDLWKVNVTAFDANGNEDGTIPTNELEILGFSAGPSDGSSSATTPTNVGSNVTFTATYNATSGRQWYLAICKTNEITAGDNAAPTCATDQTWAISSAANDSAQATATYLTTMGDAETNVWYAFACDKVASVASCSPVSQGTGDSGSPFVVSQRPILGTVKVGSECGDTAPTAPGNSKTMKVANGVWTGNDYGYAMADQSDGKIVVAGRSNNGTNYDIYIARYNTNGSLDTSFGSGGKVITPIGSGDDYAQSVAIQSDGKIVVAGGSYNGSNEDFAVVRYTSTGTLDTTFDSDGKLTFSFGSGNDWGITMAIQTDGKIVVGGYSHNGSKYDFAIARLIETDGSFDTAFDTDGKVTTAISSGDDSISSIQIQTNGKIIAGGSSNNSGNWDTTLVRYNSDGSLDTAFDSDGKLMTDISGGEDWLYSIDLQSDGKIVTAGYTVVGSDYDPAILRYNSDGSLDTSFDTDGKVIGSNTDWIVGLAIQNDGKIVTSGNHYNGSNNDFLVSRYNANGSLDTTFDSDGKAFTAIGAGGEESWFVSIQNNGKIVAGGYINNGTGNTDFALVRYNINGSLDATFDHDGKRTDSVWSGDDFANAVAIQSDGKMVLAGLSNNGTYDDFAVARYNADGSFDTTFDSDGKVTTSISSGNDWATSAVIQSDGKIIAGGQNNNGSNYDFAIVRYTSAGALDTSFSTDGKQTTAVLSGDDYGQSVAMQTDGKILVAGYSHNGTNNDFALVRYNSDGALDTSFDNDGKQTTAVLSGDDYGSSVLIQTDGKIVVSGYSNNGTNNDFAVVRYTSTGALDTSFDTDGKVTTPIGSGNDQAFSSALQGDGKIVVAGWTWNGSNYDIAVIRYNGTDGSLDTSFSTDGIATVAIGSSHDYGNSVIIQGDGKIVVGGSTYSGSNGDFSLVRFNSDGTPDTGFGTGGKATSAVGSDDDYGTSVALQSDGKFVVAGDAKYGSKYDFAFVRFNADGSVNSLTDYACVQAGVTSGSATVEMHVCSTNSFTGGVCQGTTLCTISGVKNGGNAQCMMNNEVAVPTAHGTYNIYVFLKNSNGVVDAGTGNQQSYTVADVAPSWTSYTASDSPAPTAGGSDTVDYSVALSDGNGDNDATNVKGVFFDSAAVTHDCTASENNCYITSSCALTGVSTPGTGKTATGTDAALGGNCQATVWYNANASSSWKVQAEVTDGIGNTEFIDLAATITNPPLEGINVAQSSISYGAVTVGNVSTLKTSAMENMGNQTIDIMLSGSNMTCSTGSCAGQYIPAGQQQWYHINNDFNWGRNPPTNPGPYPLVTSASGDSDGTGCLNKDISVRSVHDNTSTNEAVYWKLKIPDTQPGGTYSGQNTFSATDDATCTAGQSY